jgi:hypothetical protein
MDLHKYAELNNVEIENYFGEWYLIGYFWESGQYQPLPRRKRIGKKEGTVIRNIDKWAARLIPLGSENRQGGI